jgi:hypothetical protein
MDPAQKPAEPIEPLLAGALLRQLNPESDPADSEEAKENRAAAAREISMIFELKDLTAFKWFEKEFIDKPYQASFDALRDPRLREKNETLENIQQRYVALRAVKVGMLEREIAHREQIAPNDVEIPRLRAELERL